LAGDASFNLEEGLQLFNPLVHEKKGLARSLKNRTRKIEITGEMAIDSKVTPQKPRRLLRPTKPTTIARAT
jgi:hypothetical protein